MRFLSLSRIAIEADSNSLIANLFLYEANFYLINFFLKKEKKKNHKYDSVIDATPAPASSIAPKPFKVIPIAAKVCTNSL